LGEGADEDNHVPDLLFVLPAGFGRHLTASIQNDVEEFAVGAVAE
jgi:hypothetical protein